MNTPDRKAATDHARRVLRIRTETLARPPEPAAAEDLIEVIEFQLANERYAVESRYVREVCPLTLLAPLPCTPAFVLGVINLRGQVLSVLDLKRFFELPDKGLTDLDKVLVLEAGAMRFGVLADAVSGVRHVPPASLQRALPTLTGVRGDYLKGVGADGLVVLDGARLLAAPRIVINEDVPA